MADMEAMGTNMTAAIMEATTTGVATAVVTAAGVATVTATAMETTVTNWYVISLTRIVAVANSYRW